MRSPRSWLVASLLTFALGAAALVTGAVLIALDDAALPWHAGISSAAGGSSTASVTDDDGTTTSFTGTPDEAQSWLDREQDRLKDEHGITTRTAAGGVLRTTGIVLLVLGTGALAGVLVTRHGRDARTPLVADRSRDGAR
jgi:hypothetical protein